MFSNKYIFVYTSILVVAVAVVLALAATLLQPMQHRNENGARMQEILSAVNMDVERADAEDVYAQVIAAEMLVDAEGNVVDTANRCAFNTNMKQELDKRLKGGDAAFPVFVTHNNVYIMPLYGKGLWGAIWGYIALEDDFNTVYGVSFGHAGETPGLGAEITSPKFQNNFKGKKIFDAEGGFVSITAQKGGAEKFSGDISHAVDAVSGGTVTSKGVTAMLRDCLGYYVAFLQKHITVEPTAEQTPEEAVAESAPAEEPAVEEPASDAPEQPSAQSTDGAEPEPGSVQTNTEMAAEPVAVDEPVDDKQGSADKKKKRR